MNQSKRPSSSAPPLSIYADVGQWLGERELAQLALDAVLAHETTDPLPKGNKSTVYQPRMMLTLLGYCYARGWYASRQIEQAIVKDPMVRYLCAHRYPDWNVIRRFRRDHRGLLAACLNHIFKQAWAIKLDTLQIDRDIQLRIDLASCMDLMEVDD